MILLTTSDASWVLDPHLTSRQIAQLCKDGKIFAWKTDEGTFSKWQIPVDSLILYISMNPEYKDCVRYEHSEWLLEYIQKELQKQHHYLDETYRIGDLSYIFGTTKKQVIWYFVTKNKILAFFIYHFPFLQKPVSIRRILTTMTQRPALRKWLEIQFDQLKGTDDALESRVRHLLMLYTYYKGVVFS